MKDNKVKENENKALQRQLSPMHVWGWRLDVS